MIRQSIETPKNLLDERGLYVVNGELRGLSYWDNVEWEGNPYGVFYAPEDVTSIVDEYIEHDMNYDFSCLKGFYITDNCKSIDDHALGLIGGFDQFGADRPVHNGPVFVYDRRAQRTPVLRNQRVYEPDGDGLFPRTPGSYFTTADR